MMIIIGIEMGGAGFAARFLKAISPAQAGAVKTDRRETRNVLTAPARRTWKRAARRQLPMPIALRARLGFSRAFAGILAAPVFIDRVADFIEDGKLARQFQN